MKRLLLLASVFVLVVTVSGAVAKATSPTTSGPVQAIATQRERAALREAKALMREFVPPPGARATRRPPGYASVRVLRQSSGAVAAEFASVHGFWSVRTPLKTVTAFVRAHRLHGFGHFGAMWYTREPHYLAMGSSWPAAPDSVPRRYFDVTVVALPHVTVLRADATVVWTYPRSPSETVPADVRMIDIHVPQDKHPRIIRVLNGPKLTRIIRRFDALPIAPPGVHTACPLTLHSYITLKFRTHRGVPLATAIVPRTSAGICQPIGFKIGSHIQRPLIDNLTRGSFIGLLQQLTGLKLIQNSRE